MTTGALPGRAGPARRRRRPGQASASGRASYRSRFWSGGQWSLTLATLIIGLTVAMLFRAQTLAARPELSQPGDQARLLTDLLDANSALAQQAASLRLQR